MADHDYHVYIGNTHAIAFPTQMDALDRAAGISSQPTHQNRDVTVKHHGRTIARYRGGSRK